MTTEIWKPLVHQGIEVPGYTVSNLGHMRGKRGSILKRNSNNSGNYPRCKISAPRDLFPHYTSPNPDANTVPVYVRLHIAVADAHMPFEDNLPAIWQREVTIGGETKRIWDLMDSEQQATLRLSYQVDHIDGDKDNANVSNLRYATGRENSHYYHYESSNKQ